jgi:hypothetical protein
VAGNSVAVGQGSLRALQAVGGRQVAPGEWGLSLDCAGWPLDVGVRLHGGWLRVQAEVCGPGRLDPHALLHRSRLLTGVRFTHTSAGAVWVQLDVPAAGLTEALVDELLGRLVEAAEAARTAARGLDAV